MRAAGQLVGLERCARQILLQGPFLLSMTANAGVRMCARRPHRTKPPNDDLIRHTRQVWQPRLGHDLSGEDARQIAANVTGFFAVLAAWSRAEMPSPANDAGKPGTSESEVHHDR